jgi:hypothetical protein
LKCEKSKIDLFLGLIDKVLFSILILGGFWLAKFEREHV